MTQMERNGKQLLQKALNRIWTSSGHIQHEQNIKGPNYIRSKLCQVGSSVIQYLSRLPGRSDHMVHCNHHGREKVLYWGESVNFIGVKNGCVLSWGEELKGKKNCLLAGGAPCSCQCWCSLTIWVRLSQLHFGFDYPRVYFWSGPIVVGSLFFYINKCTLGSGRPATHLDQV